MEDEAHGTAKRRLAALLRSWWEQDAGKITQEALARRISERGVRTSQEMLSRYLHRTRPTLVRPDVIGAMHQVLGRSPEELAEALALHAEASTPAPEPTAPRPATVSGPPAAPEPAAETALSVTAGAPHPEGGAARSRWKWPWVAVAAAVVVGATVLTATETLKEDEPQTRRQPPVGATASPAPAAGAPPSTLTAECRGVSCFGIDPKYAICREDAGTYYTGHAHGVRVELRFSPTCQAAWAKMTGTSQGDVVRVTNNAGRSRHYTQQWGHDAHSTMVEALNPDDAKACARTPRGEVCATVPASPGTSTGAAPSTVVGRG